MRKQKWGRRRSDNQAYPKGLDTADLPKLQYPLKVHRRKEIEGATKTYIVYYTPALGRGGIKAIAIRAKNSDEASELIEDRRWTTGAPGTVVDTRLARNAPKRFGLFKVNIAYSPLPKKVPVKDIGWSSGRNSYLVRAPTSAAAEEYMWEWAITNKEFNACEINTVTAKFRGRYDGKPIRTKKLRSRKIVGKRKH